MSAPKETGQASSNLNLGDRKLSQTEIDFMRLIEKQNLERVQRLQKIRKNNIVTACCLGASVIGIYAYSMLSVKQEKFLDDFEEPRKVKMASGALVKSGLRLPPLPSIRDIIKLYNLRARKQLSQNFLLDQRLTDKIVRAVGHISPEDIVLEVGPGPGNITRSLLKKGPSKLILVEKDARFIPSLQILKEYAEKFGTQVDIYQADILDFSIKEAVPDESKRVHLVGNLPFSISTPLLIKWMEDISLRRQAFRRQDTAMTLTFQKEVAERICATHGGEQRCRLSVMSQIWTVPVMKFEISGKAFVPKPDVDVGVVKIIPYREPKTTIPFKIVEKVVRHVFSMRQKYCRRGFSTLFPEENRDNITEELLLAAQIDPTVRPFELSVDEFLRMAGAYYEFINKYPDIALYDYRAPKVKT